MKKYINIIGIALAATFAVSCSVEYALVPSVRVETRVIKYKKHRPAPPPPPAPAYRIPGIPPAVHNTTVIIANNNPKPAPAPRVEPKPKPHATATPAKPHATATPAKPANPPRAQVQSGRQAAPSGNVASRPQTSAGPANAASNAPSTRSSSAAAANSSRGR